MSQEPEYDYEDYNDDDPWPGKEEPDCGAPGCYDGGCSACQPGFIARAYRRARGWFPHRRVQYVDDPPF